MLTFRNGGRLVQTASELPALTGEDMFIHFATQSGDRKHTAENPWHWCSALGIAITDRENVSWYIPATIDGVREWLSDIVFNSACWIGHDVKYDAHIAKNCFGVEPPRTLIDIETRAKLIDSERSDYSVHKLSCEWLQEDFIDYFLRMMPYLRHNKNFGAVPQDVMAEYCCVRVQAIRKLCKYIHDQLPETCGQVAGTEEKLTRVLYEVEQRGLRIDKTELMSRELISLNRMSQLDEELTNITTRSFQPHTNEDCYDVLCNQYGLPVLGKTPKGDPSFTKETLEQYLALEPEVVQRIIEYRELNDFRSMFLKPYQSLQVSGVMHPIYNQCLRTGRMSCSAPPAQCLTSEAKKLIHPREGFAFISIDYSQIDFRIIVHYIRDEKAIAAYNNDPTTDFHLLMAERCEFDRKQAKTMNFRLSYGGGLAACIEALKHLHRREATKIYNGYHEALPTLRPTADRCSRALLEKGYVFNLYGRRRHLPNKFAYRAFASICQSTAADLMKERMVAVASEANIVASVHDEILFEVEKENAEEVATKLNSTLCEVEKFSVPITCAAGVSDKNWHEACQNAV